MWYQHNYLSKLKPQRLFISCYGQYACSALRVSGPSNTNSFHLTPNNGIMAHITCGSSGGWTPPSGCKNSNFDLKYIPKVIISCYNDYGGTIGACYNNKFYMLLYPAVFMIVLKLRFMRHMSQVISP